MSSRTRARGAAGVTTVHIPRRRGRRGSDPFVVVVPERPSLTREALGFLGRALWNVRTALAPTALALLALPLTAVLHALAWWSSLLLAPAAVAPLLWLAIMQRRRPARAGVLLWRAGLVLLVSIAAAWLALAAAFGPFSGPLAAIWLLVLIAAQTAWLVVRRSH
ncbi:hypothetical protein [Streptomyces rishiriensis]|uniref:hypothetical protein n=1 Tax=Streptomyces rishiriensis TaxID=68264 RepID=UPI000D59627C|nr:hypothetical protein [Streptomyces rishiriensis]